MNTLGQQNPDKPGAFYIEANRLNYFRPHRYPMVLLEDVTECYMPEKRLTGTKKIKLDDPYVQAHFPGEPSMPASFVVECLAQAAGCLMNLVFYHDRGIHLWEVKADDFFKLEQPPYNVLAEAKIKQFALARPGETLTLQAKVALQRKDIIAFHTEAAVGSRLIAKGDIILAYPPYTPIAQTPEQLSSEPTHGTS